MKKRILFIINPISGGKSKKNFAQFASANLNKKVFEPTFQYSQFVGHASKLAEQAVAAGTDVVVAVGGDGTINEVATELENTKTVMGIIPCGSGNGLARFLKIPLNDKAAIEKINQLNIQSIDSAAFNKKKFFNMAGVGFDAHISSLFAKKHKRGFQGYIKTTLHEIASYQSLDYRIEIDNRVILRRAFMISIANSSQYGNNAHISPKASIQDGLLDLCIIKPFPLYHFPLMGFHMFSKTADKSKYVEIIKGKQIKISREQRGAVHLDGEPEEMGQELEIEVKPLSLKILV